jgi:hypothetical protein
MANQDRISNAINTIATGRNTGTLVEIRQHDVVIELDSGIQIVRSRSGGSVLPLGERVSPVVPEGCRVRLVILDAQSALWVADEPLQDIRQQQPET